MTEGARKETSHMENKKNKKTTNNKQYQMASPTMFSQPAGNPSPWKSPFLPPPAMP